MAEPEKPFVMVRRNRFLFNIMPANRRGWAVMGVWMVLLVPIVILFERHAGARPGGPELPALLAFLGATALWAVGGIMWMRARAEVIDVDALLKARREGGRKGPGR